MKTERLGSESSLDRVVQSMAGYNSQKEYTAPLSVQLQRSLWFRQNCLHFLVNKITLKGQIGSTCMGPLASEMTFAKKQIITRSKTALVLARIEF